MPTWIIRKKDGSTEIIEQPQDKEAMLIAMKKAMARKYKEDNMTLEEKEKEWTDLTPEEIKEKKKEFIQMKYEAKKRKLEREKLSHLYVSPEVFEDIRNWGKNEKSWEDKPANPKSQIDDKNEDRFPDSSGATWWASMNNLI